MGRHRGGLPEYVGGLGFEDIDRLLRQSENERAHAVVGWLMDIDPPRPRAPKVKTAAQRAGVLRRKKARRQAGYFSRSYLVWYIAYAAGLTGPIGDGQTLPPRPKHGILNCSGCGRQWGNQAQWHIGEDGRGLCPMCRDRSLA